jgi:23S rRNA pseudouridine2605 synthase
MKKKTADISSPRHGLARVISKQGLASRTQAATWIHEGRVSVNGRVVCDAEYPVRMDLDRVVVAGQSLALAERQVLMLNKPRGLITSVSDEQGRDTVYTCLADAGLPWLAPVGRLDKASEGLLLFTNDPHWASTITHPDTGPDKTYHVQVNALPGTGSLLQMMRGMNVDGEMLIFRSVRLLRGGQKNAWLEIVLDEGRNRQIRRLLAAFDLEVLRLIRVAVGQLQLGPLAKGRWRILNEADIAAMLADRDGSPPQEPCA